MYKGWEMVYFAGGHHILETRQLEHKDHDLFKQRAPLIMHIVNVSYKVYPPIRSQTFGIGRNVLDGVSYLHMMKV